MVPAAVAPCDLQDVHAAKASIDRLSRAKDPFDIELGSELGCLSSLISVSHVSQRIMQQWCRIVSQTCFFAVFFCRAIKKPRKAASRLLPEVFHLQQCLPMRFKGLKEGAQQVRDVLGSRVNELVEGSELNQDDLKRLESMLSEMKSQLFGTSLRNLMSKMKKVAGEKEGYDVSLAHQQERLLGRLRSSHELSGPLVGHCCCLAWFLSKKSVKPSRREIPVDRLSAPVHHDSLPVNRLSAPVHHDSLPVNRLSAPVHHDSLPVNRLSAPVHHDSLPVNRLNAPVHHDSLPVNRLSAPLNHDSLADGGFGGRKDFHQIQKEASENHRTVQDMQLLGSHVSKYLKTLEEDFETILSQEVKFEQLLKQVPHLGQSFAARGMNASILHQVLCEWDLQSCADQFLQKNISGKAFVELMTEKDFRDLGFTDDLTLRRLKQAQASRPVDPQSDRI